ncbi:MAG TPA: tripartite tricarboxylate transporter substrate binding protein [Acetobacteraceae bacterium]|nr:tripartite tricarboxylate transporter substrate binding protein [Acetobacteraceae bacterium]
MPEIRTGRRLLLAGALALPVIARAQAAWPGERPIGFVVPFPPGGGTDVMARAMVPHLERHLPGARFVVLNRPGAGAEIGYTAVATAAPDGYTMGVAITPSLQTITIERQPRYRLEDLSYLGAIVDDPGAFFVAPDSDLRTLRDLAEFARANPDRVSVGTAGIGSDDHLLMMAFQRAAGVRMTHVPFAGQAPTVTALLGRHITVAAMNIGESMELLRQNQIRGLALAGERRWPLAPDLPTFRESGFNLVGGVVRGLIMPAATPEPIQARLAAALDAVMEDPAWQAEAERLFQPLRRMGREEYRRHVFAAAEELRAVWQRMPWRD